MANVRNREIRGTSLKNTRMLDSDKKSALGYSRHMQNTTNLEYQPTQGPGASFYKQQSKRHSNSFSDTDALKQLKLKSGKRNLCRTGSENVSIHQRENRFYEKYGGRARSCSERMLEQTRWRDLDHSKTIGLSHTLETYDNNTESVCDAVSFICSRSDTPSMNSSRPNSQENFKATTVPVKKIDVETWLCSVAVPELKCKHKDT